MVITFILLVFYMTFEPFVLKFLSGYVFLLAKYSSDTIIMFLFVLTLLRTLRRRSTFSSGGLFKGLMMFLIIWFSSSLLNRTGFILSLSALRLMIRFVVLFLIIVNLELKGGDIQKLIRCLFVAGMVQVFVSVLEFISPAEAQEFFKPEPYVELFGRLFPITGAHEIGGRGRLFGTMGRYDILGFFLSMLFCISIAFYANCPSGGRRRIHFCLSGLFTIVILLTLSRMSIGTCMVGVVLVPLLAKRHRGVWLFAGGFLAILALSLSLEGLPELYLGEASTEAGPIDRMLVLLNPEYTNLNLKTGRFFILIEGFNEVLSKSPVYGLGPGLIGSASGGFFGATKAYDMLNIHKETFEVWGDVGWSTFVGQYGLVGIVVLLYIYYSILRLAVRGYRCVRAWQEKALCEGYFAFLLSFVFIWHFFSNPLEARIPSFFFWVYTALVISVGRHALALHGRNNERSQR